MDLQSLFAGSFLFRHQLNQLGLTDAMLRRLVRDGVLARPRHGTYVHAATWTSAGEVGRHAIVTRSVLARLGPGVAASHQSAAVLHGLDLWDVDLSHVHVTRVGCRGGRREAGVVFHEGRLDVADVVDVAGYPAVPALRASFETASCHGVEAGMVVMSSALRRTGADHRALFTCGDAFDHWPGTRVGRLAIRLSDARFESVGEVRGFYLFWRGRVPGPELQLEIRDGDGLAGRVDYGWPERRHTAEFDGMVKYGRLNPFLDEPGRVLEAEKAREDRIRAAGWGMSRFTWHDLAPAARERTAARIREDVERSRRLFAGWEPASARS